ncbi:MAG: glycosyltransferase [Limisphaerales bacterium]
MLVMVPVFACLALLSATLLVWQWIAAARFHLQPPPDPASPAPAATARHPQLSHPLPPVSISVLKPVTGSDPGTAEALASWLRFHSQPAHSVEVLFGVGSTEDPAHALVLQLLDRHPNATARLVVCPRHHALNRKVAKLIHLAREARGDVVIISDADVAAPPHLLNESIPLLDSPGTGLVHCLYRISKADTPANRWEAFVVNADFWSQVLQNRSFRPVDFALGAVMILRRTTVDAVGGFEALANVLADDNRLGRLVVDQGLRTVLSPVVVDCIAAPAGWKEVWRHQLRWAVTIRVCQPGAYFLSILANGTLWPILWGASAGSGPAIPLAALLIGFRVVQAISLESRFTGTPRKWASAWLPPVKDLLQVGLWVSAFLKNHIVWRGARYRVNPDGTLQPALSQFKPPAPPSASAPASGKPPDTDDALAGSGIGIPRGKR